MCLVQVLRARRISDAGVQQLLLDCHALKTLLLALPAVGGGSADRKPPASYARLVAAEAGKVEAVLKVAPPPPPRSLVLSGHAASLTPY